MFSTLQVSNSPWQKHSIIKGTMWQNKTEFCAKTRDNQWALVPITSGERHDATKLDWTLTRLHCKEALEHTHYDQLVYTASEQHNETTTTYNGSIIIN